jgi:hypothetical protein
MDAVWIIPSLALLAVVLWRAWPYAMKELRRRETMSEEELKESGWHDK